MGHWAYVSLWGRGRDRGGRGSQHPRVSAAVRGPKPLGMPAPLASEGRVLPTCVACPARQQRCALCPSLAPPPLPPASRHAHQLDSSVVRCAHPCAPPQRCALCPPLPPRRWACRAARSRRSWPGSTSPTSPWCGGAPFGVLLWCLGSYSRVQGVWAACGASVRGGGGGPEQVSPRCDLFVTLGCWVLWREVGINRAWAATMAHPCPCPCPCPCPHPLEPQVAAACIMSACTHATLGSLMAGFWNATGAQAAGRCGGRGGGVMRCAGSAQAGRRDFQLCSPGVRGECLCHRTSPMLDGLSSHGLLPTLRPRPAVQDPDA